MKNTNSAYINAKITELKKNDINSFQTNYFFNCISNNILYAENEHAVIFLIEDRFIFRFYFACNRISYLEDLLKNLPQDKYIRAEIITKKEIDRDLYECINSTLPFDTVFEKMRCKVENLKTFTAYSYEEIEYACENDTVTVEKILDETFNYYSSHHSSKEELQDLIKNKNIIALKEENEISSLVILKNKGNIVNFDQLVSKNKNPANLIKLIDYTNTKIKHEQYKEVFLWVDTIYNKDVVKLHKLYRYKPDGTKDFYFINNISKLSKK